MSSTNSHKPSSVRATRTLLAALLATSCLAGATAAMAQAAPAKTDGQSVTTLEDLVVTARLRSETLQNVPVAISVVTGALAMQENRNDLTALIAVIPSVEFRSQPSNKDQDILIRGLGTITTSAGAEPTVSTVIDGVVLARPGQMVSDLIDLDHIEVLRGPQGTLFGKNASAGVISIVTKDPTPTPGGFIDASYYTGNEYRIAGAVNGEIIKDVLSGRLAGVTSSFDGNVTNVFNHTKINGDDFQGGARQAALDAVERPARRVRRGLYVHHAVREPGRLHQQPQRRLSDRRGDHQREPAVGPDAPRGSRPRSATTTFPRTRPTTTGT